VQGRLKPSKAIEVSSRVRRRWLDSECINLISEKSETVTVIVKCVLHIPLKCYVQKEFCFCTNSKSVMS
jgi:hypothetical protein